MNLKTVLIRIYRGLGMTFQASVKQFLAGFCVLLAAAISFANQACIDGLYSSREQRVMNYGQIETSYTEVRTPYRLFKVNEDLPEIRDALVVHIKRDGHLHLWYQGRRIDSKGPVMVAVRNYLKAQSAFEPGIMISIHNLPADFPARFNEMVENFRSQSRLTCVAVGCAVMRELSDDQIVDREFIRVSSFIRYFMEQRRSRPQGAEGIRFWSLGDRMENHLQAIDQKQRSEIDRIALNVSLASGIGVVAIPTIISITLNLLSH